MTKVTDLPSGQRLVWPLQTFTRSGKAMADTELDLLETSARSRAAASEMLVARNRQTLKALRRNTGFLPQGETGLAAIFVETGHQLNVTKVMYPVGLQRSSKSRAYSSAESAGP